MTAKKKRLRLLKVMVQPVFVLDDGSSLREVNAGASTIHASDWATWATTAYEPEALKGLLAQIDKPTDAEA